MLRLIKNDRESIDFFFEDLADRDRRPLHEKILDFAMTGMTLPESLSVRRVWHALVAHYAEMGIGHDPVVRR